MRRAVVKHRGPWCSPPSGAWTSVAHRGNTTEKIGSFVPLIHEMRWVTRPIASKDEADIFAPPGEIVLTTLTQE
jgi:hypothetical protein